MISVTKNNIHTTSHAEETFLHRTFDNPIMFLNISQSWNQVLLHNLPSVWHYQPVSRQKSLLIYCAIWLLTCGASGQSLKLGYCKLPALSEIFNMWNYSISWPVTGSWTPRLLLPTQMKCSPDPQLPWGPRLITQRHLSSTTKLDLQLNSIFFFFSFSRFKFQPHLAQTPKSNPQYQAAGRLENRLRIGTLDFFLLS